MTPEHVLFIINPKSGTNRRIIDETMIRNHFDHPHWQISYTEYPGHAREIAQDALMHYDTIVAVGGDGTVNEIASALQGSDSILGIIPRGSGNGLSNTLHIPKDLKGALSVLSGGQSTLIDSMFLNEHCFVNMAGIGFDAHIAHLFKDFGPRGFISYARLVLREFGHYEGVKVEVVNNGSVSKMEPFLLSFANSTQYGNNAHVAPQALMDDGLVDVCSVDRFPLTSSPDLLYKLFSRKLTDSKYYHSFKAAELSIESENELLAHVDGEPLKLGNKVQVRVKQRNLKILVP